MPGTIANYLTNTEKKCRFLLRALAIIIGVYLAVSSNVPRRNLLELDVEWNTLEQELWSKIYGQDEVIQRILQTLRIYRKSTHGFQFKMIILIGDESSEKYVISDLILRNIKCIIHTNIMRKDYCGVMKQTEVLFSRRDSAQSCIFSEESGMLRLGRQCGFLRNETMNLSDNLSREVLATISTETLDAFDRLSVNLGYMSIVIGTLHKNKEADELQKYLEKHVPRLDFTIIQLAPSSREKDSWFLTDFKLYLDSILLHSENFTTWGHDRNMSDRQNL